MKNKKEKKNWLHNVTNPAIIIFTLIIVLFAGTIGYIISEANQETAMCPEHETTPQNFWQQITLIGTLLLGLAFIIHGANPLQLVNVSITNNYDNEEKEEETSARKRK